VANVWFCSDLHFGHKKIGGFRYGYADSEEANRKRISDDWRKSVTKRDIVYVLGDACFTMDTVEDFKNLPGKKILIRGNHDLLDTQVYLKYFESVFGLLKYKEFWLSHAPIHPNELRSKINLHGHVHYQDVDDQRYFNMSVESLWKRGYPSLISLEQIRNLIKGH